MGCRLTQRFAAVASAVLLGISIAALADEGRGTSSTLGEAREHVTGEGFQFALIGDVPYAQADEPKFDRVIDAINADRRIAWVLHAGDIKSGSSLCSDQMFLKRFETFQHFAKPFVYTPGDNEWTDCHRQKAGGYAPLERLARLRTIFFPNPGFTTGGRMMPVETQASVPGYEGFPENVRWSRSNVTFATLHIVGSENATLPFAGRTAADDEEVVRRTAAAVAWIEDTFRQAEERESAGVFLMIHADPSFDQPANSSGRKGFNAFLNAVEREAIKYGRPVVLAHGDSHYFRVDKPLVSQVTGRLLEHFTRAETFGAADVHWVRVVVNPRDPEVFEIRQEIVEANAESHPLP